MLMLHRRLIALRRAEPALSVGDYRPVPASGNVLAYRRSHGERDLWIALNLGATPARLGLPADLPRARVVLSTSGSADGRYHEGEVPLEANQGLVLERAGGTDVLEAGRPMRTTDAR